MKSSLLIITALAVSLSVAGCGKKENAAEPTPNLTPVAAAEKLDPARPDSTLAKPAVAAQPISTEPVFQARGNRDVIYSVSSKGKKVALTFDDGPDNKYTARILDILKEQGVPATFFLVGKHVQQYPQMVKRISQEGHAIGNHSWDHANLARMSPADVQGEITKTDEAIKSLTGEAPVLFRAPYGAISQEVVNDAIASGHQLIGWSVDTMDWDGKSPATILTTLKKELKPGAIVLQHSAGGKGGNLANTVEALPQLIAYLKKEGYQFVTVTDLIKS
ncbi:polysaccharide deacetylase family protein [Paenibacillus filicis]|uniref:Polysaccharide deacetylase family protein n=1 Tax=Paenibacillus gyeongsangnamensis TaxID=3388067 RepID=A0ABT4Q6D0_9BACL|nr:polysaccharide deacetylase family protein [Paenibacillus filicis]MCZ8512260.1 polysaccharide deacetylase family protein [Paenibacillus filicis]